MNMIYNCYRDQTPTLSLGKGEKRMWWMMSVKARYSLRSFNCSTHAKKRRKRKGPFCPFHLAPSLAAICMIDFRYAFSVTRKIRNIHHWCKCLLNLLTDWLQAPITVSFHKQKTISGTSRCRVVLGEILPLTTTWFMTPPGTELPTWKPALCVL